MKGSLAERFWAKVDVRGPDECWEWIASLNSYGYGVIGVGDKTIRAHRLSWEIHNGPIPKGMCVLHTCDHPSCVNPNHLFVGSRADNNADAAEKGHQSRGESRWNAKLTEQKVRKIWTLVGQGTLTQQAIGEKYGVNQSTVSYIKTRRSWAWVI